MRDWLNHRRGRARIPEDNRSLVEAATHPTALRKYADRLGHPWSTHHAEWEAVGLAQAGVAKTACLDWNRPLPENQPDLDRQAATRLGLLDRRVDFGTPPAGPFGVPVRSSTSRVGARHRPRRGPRSSCRPTSSTARVHSAFGSGRSPTTTGSG